MNVDVEKLIDKLFITHKAEYLSVDLKLKCVIDDKQFLFFKDYGKTWALDKKDLTNE